MSKTEKKFDAVAVMRSIRDRVSAEIEGMTLEEELAWLASQELKDPFLKRLRDRAARQADAADDAAHRRRIAEQFDPERIILFGSRASGRARGDSEVHLLVVMRCRESGARKAAEILNRVAPEFAVDLIVRTPQELRRRLAQEDRFLADIVRRGKVLFETAHPGMGREGRGRQRNLATPLPPRRLERAHTVS